MTRHSHMSVSLGSRAVPAVTEAVAHAHAFPEHDPIVFMHVTADPPGQEVYWECRECNSIQPWDTHIEEPT